MVAQVLGLEAGRVGLLLTPRRVLMRGRRRAAGGWSTHQETSTVCSATLFRGGAEVPCVPIWSYSDAREGARPYLPRELVTRSTNGADHRLEGEPMQKNVVTSMVLGALLLIGRTALAADTVADNVRKSCSKELSTFCKGVPEGEGRILACRLRLRGQGLRQVRPGGVRRCGSARTGRHRREVRGERVQGRPPEVLRRCEARRGPGLACLNKHDKDVSQTCKDALKATGIRK